MQQYYDVDNGGGTLTAFHTDDGVSLDMEHFGTVFVEDTTALRGLQSGQKETMTVDNSRQRSTAEMERRDDGGVTIHIDGRRNVSVQLSPEQFSTLIDSLGEGDSSVGYAVESVGRDGVRHRSE